MAFGFYFINQENYRKARMSEESNVVVLSAEKDENLESKNGIMKKDNGPEPALHSDESPFTENAEAPAEKVQENRQPIESAQPEEENRPVLGSLESNVEESDSSSSEQQLSTSEASTETKSLERTSDNEPTVHTSSEISLSQVPASDKGLGGVTENIQLIYEGLKDMKISTQEIPVSASGKKGRKPPTTPRARSTPVKLLTSPPLTRSRSRDLRKFPSTPVSPLSSASRKTSESDSDEMKGARGRQRAKKN